MTTPANEIVTQVLSAKKEFITDGYTMSIGEINSMYKDGELIINPDFQRAFRWSLKQQSKLIESILIGVPLPSIFVYQNKEGKWEVVDGVQRLSTIIQFIGDLRNEANEKLEPTVLEETKLLSALKGMTWENIPNELQLDFKRSRLEVKIIKYLSDKNSKFEVFQRLNYSPTILSGQEYRNALLIMVDKAVYDWMVELANYSNFKNCLDLADRWLQEKYDQELVLRLFIFPSYQFKHKKVDEYIDESIFYDENSILKKIESGEFNLKIETERFRKTFDFLNEVKGIDVFKKQGKGQQFLESYYEAIAIGLYANIDDYSNQDFSLIGEKISELDNQEEFQRGKGSGTNSEIRIKRLIPFAKRYFEKNKKSA